MADSLMGPATGLVNSKLALADAGAENVLSGKKFYAGDKVIKTGSMPNNGAWKATINPGQTIQVPPGYHNGSGLVAANSVSVFVKQKTITIGNRSECTLDTSHGGYRWRYTLTGGTLLGFKDLGQSSISSSDGGAFDCASLTISGNTIEYACSGNGVTWRTLTLLYY